jgi:hypothetical protein
MFLLCHEHNPGEYDSVKYNFDVNVIEVEIEDTCKVVPPYVL